MKEKHRILSRKNLKEVNKLEDRLLEQNFKYIIGFKIGSLLSGILLVLLLTASLILSPVYPKQSTKITALKENLQTKVIELSTSDTFKRFNEIQVSNFNIIPGNVKSGGLSKGQLNLSGEVNFSYNTALHVDAPDVGTSIYLKAYAGSIYENNKWKELNTKEQEEFNKISQTWKNSNFKPGDQSGYLLSLVQSLSEETYTDLSFSFGQIKIESVNADANNVYVPYFSLFGRDNSFNQNREDYVSSNNKQKAYTFSYFNTFSNLYDFNEQADYEKCIKKYRDITYGTTISNEEKDILAELQGYRLYESVYRKYVYSNYLQVPTKGLEELKSEFSSMNIENYKEKYGDKALSTLVMDVRNRIQKDTSYSLNPGKVPRDKDLIEYFLYDNKKGYCSHYASAATMIFRIMGVPARYVEGYVIKTDNLSKGEKSGLQTMVSRRDGNINIQSVDSKAMDIKDANAHAWVEIYVNGFGWVPVEMTPSGSIEANYEQRPLNGNQSQSEKDKNKENTATSENKDKQEEKQLEEKQKEKDNLSKEKEEQNKNKKNQAGLSAKTNQVSKDRNSQNTVGYIFYLKKAGKVTLWSMVLFLGILISFFLRFLIIMNMRKSMRNKSESHDKKVLLCYQEMNKILEYNRINLEKHNSYRESVIEAERTLQLSEPGSFQKFVDIVLKAKFSKDIVTAAELNEAEEFYKTVISRLYENKTPIEKIYLKFIKIFHI